MRVAAPGAGRGQPVRPQLATLGLLGALSSCPHDDFSDPYGLKASVMVLTLVIY